LGRPSPDELQELPNDLEPSTTGHDALHLNNEALSQPPPLLADEREGERVVTEKAQALRKTPGFESGIPSQESPHINVEAPIESHSSVRINPTSSQDSAQPAATSSRSTSNEPLNATHGVIATDFAHVSHRSSGEQGAPRLTPLREMMEASAETSDDASSVGTPIVHGRSEPSQPADQAFNDRQTQAEPKLPANVSHNRQGSAYSIGMGDTGERAHTQRLVSQSPVKTPREPVMPTGRRSDSFGRSGHAPHDSQGRASLIGRQQDGLERHQSSAARSARSTRSSGDHRSLTSERPLRSAVRSVDKGKSFDQLIKSNETIQFSLTPQTMRQIEVSSSLQPLTSCLFATC
jgi:hypothetical protein